MSVTNLTGYTWVANDSLSTLNYDAYNRDLTINFTCGSNTYTHLNMYLDMDDLLVWVWKYDDTLVYDEMNGWTDDQYKTITITGGASVEDEDTIAWFEQNGTLTAPAITTALKFFNLTANNFKLGSLQVNKLYLGSQALWEYVNNYGTLSNLITMELGNADPEAGINNTYRILSINGSIAEVVAMYDVATATKFGSSTSYENSSLDIALNDTFYNSLSETAKAAIVDKTFTQDGWYISNAGDPDYTGYYGQTNPGSTEYVVSKGSTTGNQLTRHIYALSLEDVINYVTDTSVGDGQLQNYNIWKMLYNTTTKPTTITVPMLRTLNAGEAYETIGIEGGYGRISSGTYGYPSRAIRPAFTIDLSKIDHTILTE